MRPHTIDAMMRLAGRQQTAVTVHHAGTPEATVVVQIGRAVIYLHSIPAADRFAKIWQGAQPDAAAAAPPPQPGARSPHRAAGHRRAEHRGPCGRHPGSDGPARPRPPSGADVPRHPGRQPGAAPVRPGGVHRDRGGLPAGATGGARAPEEGRPDPRGATARGTGAPAPDHGGPARRARASPSCCRRPIRTPPTPAVPSPTVPTRPCPSRCARPRRPHPAPLRGADHRVRRPADGARGGGPLGSAAPSRPGRAAYLRGGEAWATVAAAGPQPGGPPHRAVARQAHRDEGHRDEGNHRHGRQLAPPGRSRPPSDPAADRLPRMRWVGRSGRRCSSWRRRCPARTWRCSCRWTPSRVGSIPVSTAPAYRIPPRPPRPATSSSASSSPPTRTDPDRAPRSCPRNLGRPHQARFVTTPRPSQTARSSRR